MLSVSRGRWSNEDVSTTDAPLEKLWILGPEKTSVKTPDSHSSDYLPPMRVSWFTAVRWDAVESRL